MPEKYLFIVRSPSELEICSKELPVDTNLFSMAHSLMDVVRQEYKGSRVDHCEIWHRTSLYNMTLLVTVF